MTSKTLPLLLSWALFGALETCATLAGAAPSYPRNIQSNLKLNYAPPCSICHQNGQTGDGTPIEPFAWSMRARGLTGSKNTLTPALTADQADDVDSDGDGITDIDELKNGTDVNSPANECIIPSGTSIDPGQCTPGAQASPTLGCDLSAVPPAPGAERFGPAILMGFIVAAVRRRFGRVLSAPRAQPTAPP